MQKDHRVKNHLRINQRFACRKRFGGTHAVASHYGFRPISQDTAPTHFANTPTIVIVPPNPLESRPCSTPRNAPSLALHLALAILSITTAPAEVSLTDDRKDGKPIAPPPNPLDRGSRIRPDPVARIPASANDPPRLAKPQR